MCVCMCVRCCFDDVDLNLNKTFEKMCVRVCVSIHSLPNNWTRFKDARYSQQKSSFPVQSFRTKVFYEVFTILSQNTQEKMGVYVLVLEIYG